jgi:hypothetical protein
MRSQVERIDENMYRANIKLQDENKLLKQDIKDLRIKLQEVYDFVINKSIEYKPGYRKVNLDTKDCIELINILESEFI